MKRAVAFLLALVWAAAGARDVQLKRMECDAPCTMGSCRYENCVDGADCPGGLCTFFNCFGATCKGQTVR
eukprot:scaffold2618_cov240-Pinguiococcus_pyrenoidosus.AAC.6